jgi:hypothetical protein
MTDPEMPTTGENLIKIAEYAHVVAAKHPVGDDLNTLASLIAELAEQLHATFAHVRITPLP